MLPRRIATQAENNNNSNVARLNAAFVADNGSEEPKLELKLKQNQHQHQQLEEDEPKSISASGNIEAETNKLELVDNDEFDKYKSGDDSSASASNTIVRKDRLTMLYNEETEEQKNLNESSSVVDSNGNENENRNGSEDATDGDIDEKNHEIQVTTALNLSDAADEDAAAVVLILPHHHHDDDDDDNENLHESIEKIRGTATELEDVSYEHIEGAVADSSMPYSNLAINRADREDADSSDDEDERVEMSEAFNSEWASELGLGLGLEMEVGGVEENLASNNEFHVPVDLSNDILVNDYAVAQNVPYNPDAESIELTSTTVKNSSMPMFEKLSMH